MKKEMIVFMGGQGVGKGTFAKMLLERNKYDYIEAGAILRSLPAEHELSKIMARGDLVPDEKLFDLLSSKINPENDIILDGFPRTIGQAKWLVENFSDIFDIKILYLNISEELMIKRIQKRIREGGGRADDADPNIIRRRLNNFWDITIPAIKWLETSTKITFLNVEPTGEQNDNFNAILHALHKL